MKTLLKVHKKIKKKWWMMMDPRSIKRQMIKLVKSIKHSLGRGYMQSSNKTDWKYLKIKWKHRCKLIHGRWANNLCALNRLIKLMLYIDSPKLAFLKLMKINRLFACCSKIAAIGWKTLKCKYKLNQPITLMMISCHIFQKKNQKIRILPSSSNGFYVSRRLRDQFGLINWLRVALSVRKNLDISIDSIIVGSVVLQSVKTAATIKFRYQS